MAHDYAQVRELIPRLLALKQKRLLDRTMLANAGLARRPETLDEYVAFCKTLESTDREYDELAELVQVHKPVRPLLDAHMLTSRLSGRLDWRG